MGLPDKIEESVNRVTLRSSTKDRVEEPREDRRSKNRRRKTRSRKEPDPSDSQESDDPEVSRPVATSENGVGTSRIPEDISEEVR